MDLRQPYLDKQYYEAYVNGELIGVYPEPNAEAQLSFGDWLEDMASISTHGFNVQERKARQARCSYLLENPNAPLHELDLANFMPIDKRRYRRKRHEI